jgi:hypothetical protein
LKAISILFEPVAGLVEEEEEEEEDKAPLTPPLPPVLPVESIALADEALPLVLLFVAGDILGRKEEFSK